MQKQRSPQQKRSQRSKLQKRSPQPKKLPLKVRRRNRAIALVLLGLIIFFTVRQCSDDAEKGMIESNQSVTVVMPTKIVEKNSTIEDTKDENSQPTKTKVQKHIDRKDEKTGEKSKVESALLPNDPILAKDRLLENYRKKGSFKSALDLAEYFYSYKKYKEAVKWAIVTNKLDMNQFRPWYIYIKSKIALGDKERAKVALKFYLKSHKSKKFDALLKKLEED